MLETRRFLYVGFMCHQVIEKILKAYWSKVLEELPLKIHHLSRLAAKSGLIDELSEEQLGFIDSLEPLNIEAITQYPFRFSMMLLPKHFMRSLKKTKLSF